MKLALKFALRYLFSKKSHSAINIISMVCVGGVAITSMAIICTMSIFNGFHELVSSLYSSFDPQVKITAAQGKSFTTNTALFDELRASSQVDILTEVLEENALISYNDHQISARLKGVSENFRELTQINSLLVSGEFTPEDSIANMACLGIGIASQLSVNSGFVRPLLVFAPKKGANVSLTNPQGSFNEELLMIGSIFRVNQPQYDDNMIIVSLEFARELFGYEDEVTALELKLKPDVDTDKFITKLKRTLGDSYIIQNQYQQQADSYKMMMIEKWMTFLILSFILMIAAFNIIGSLSMLIIDKKDDIKTLRNIGADNKLIRRIFLIEGWLISGIGALAGITIGIILCLIQQKFGIVSLGSSGMFIVDSYPVKLIWSDILIVVAIVITIGLTTAWIPVRRIEP
ncbi:MAG: FtsX-like permease family protein [Bacteroidales bacterium]